MVSSSCDPVHMLTLTMVSTALQAQDGPLLIASNTRGNPYRRFSCSICCMEFDLWRIWGAGGAVGRCHVVVLFTWST